MKEKHQVGSTEHGHGYGLTLGRVSEASVGLEMKEILHWAATA